MEPREWQHGAYLISTRQDLLQAEAVNDALASDWFYWGKRERLEDVERMLKGSLCFAVYERAEGGSTEGDVGPVQPALCATDDFSLVQPSPCTHRPGRPSARSGSDASSPTTRPLST